MELQEVKDYLRVDEPDEDGHIQNLITAAEQFMEGAGVPITARTLALYGIAVKMLVSHWYENREIVGKADELAFSLTHIITQLKYVPFRMEEKL
jgi:uncharacterized phage protein (predicted DNA packaging)